MFSTGQITNALTSPQNSEPYNNYFGVHTPSKDVFFIKIPKIMKNQPLAQKYFLQLIVTIDGRGPLYKITNKILVQIACPVCLDNIMCIK